MGGRIVVVDDERGIANSLQLILNISGYQCEVAYSGEEALQVVAATDPDVVISDVVMPEMNGIELATRLRESHPRLRVILLSGNAVTQDLLTEAGSTVGEILILPKPYSPPELLRIIAEEYRKAQAAG